MLDERHLLAAVRYIELNPVHASMVEYAWEYPWSSAGFHAGSTTSDPLVKDSTLMGLISDWKGFLAEGMGAGEADRIRTATQTGLPAGNHDFVIKIAGLTGRELSKGKLGRPRKQ